MTETPLYFESGAHRLFGVLHEPERRTGVPYVFCHPFAEDKLWSHRVFVSFARELASGGHPVLRFDYMGNGDSEGGFEQSSVHTGARDVERAIDFLRVQTGASGVGLLGLRFGASLAAVVAERRDDVCGLVLWAPIVNGDRYLQELLRANVATQMAVYREVRVDRTALVAALAQGRTVNVDGYELAPAMCEQLAEIDLTRRPSRYAGRCVIVQIERSAAAKPSPELQKLCALYARASLRVAQSVPFWKETESACATLPDLFRVTREWMAGEERDGPGEHGGHGEVHHA